MSDDLLTKTCVPCRGGIPPLTRTEAETWLQQAPGWALVDDGRRIERTFSFRNFKEAMNFVAKVGDLSEIKSGIILKLLSDGVGPRSPGKPRK